MQINEFSSPQILGGRTSLSREIFCVCVSTTRTSWLLELQHSRWNASFAVVVKLASRNWKITTPRLFISCLLRSLMSVLAGFRECHNRATYSHRGQAAIDEGSTCNRYGQQRGVVHAEELGIWCSQKGKRAQNAPDAHPPYSPQGLDERRKYKELQRGHDQASHEQNLGHAERGRSTSDGR